VCGGSVGSGSYAAVLFPLTGAEEVQVETCAVGSRVSSLDCEVEGIALSITMAIKYFGQYVMFLGNPQKRYMYFVLVQLTLLIKCSLELVQIFLLNLMILDINSKIFQLQLK